MKVRAIVFFLLFVAIVPACRKDTVSKIPHIALTEFLPVDSMIVGVDTVLIVFNFQDGDGDISNDTGSGIYLKDMRFDTAPFIRTPFPKITPATIEDPTKGLTGTCTFYPDPPTQRLDSLHSISDTLVYQLYITDRAGHKSNVLTTRPLIMKP